MPDEPTTTIPAQEVFASGTHNGEVISKQDLDQMIEASQGIAGDFLDVPNTFTAEWICRITEVFQ